MIFKKHYPLHIYEGSFYFISARCLNGADYFLTDHAKRIFRNILKQAVGKFEIKIYAWVVLDNHYHLLLSLPILESNFAPVGAQFNTPDNSKHVLIEFIRKLHKDSAREINKNNNQIGRQVWYQYWDWCIRNEEDFWYHFVYIVQNSLKHKLTSNWEETFNYRFSSNATYLKNKSEAWLHDCLYYYPVKDWTPEGCE